MHEAAVAKQVTGRKGLGRGIGAAVGHDWRGSKKAFDDNAEEDAEQEPVQEAEEDTAAVAACEVPSHVSKLKWRALAAAALAEAPKGRLSERKLRKATVAAAKRRLAERGEGVEVEEVHLVSAFEAKVLTSSRFSRTPCGRLTLATPAEPDAQPEQGKKKRKATR